MPLAHKNTYTHTIYIHDKYFKLNERFSYRKNFDDSSKQSESEKVAEMWINEQKEIFNLTIDYKIHTQKAKGAHTLHTAGWRYGNGINEWTSK